MRAATVVQVLRALVLSFIACFILVVIAPLRQAANVRRPTAINYLMLPEADACAGGGDWIPGCKLAKIYQTQPTFLTL